MRSSVLITSALAAFAIAQPLKAIAKKEYVYDITTEVVTVTVTVPATTSSKSRHSHSNVHVSTVKVVTTIVVAPTQEASSSIYVAPAPTTTSAYVVPVPTSTSVIPEYSAPAVVSETTTAIPEPTTSAAPVEPTTSATPTASSPADVVQVLAVASTSAVPVSAAGATAVKPTDYKGIALWHHNKHRANHTAGALTWSSDLATRALATANTCVFAHDMYQGGGGYGQNLAAYGSTNLGVASNNGAVADAITNQWYYGEAANMPYGVDTPDITGPEFLHFSAMLWTDSTSVGCATVTCASGTVFSSMPSLYTVCDYQTTGNILGEFATRVLKPVGTAGITASALDS